jgi:CubicO group peptidase (beta-lactamase class C family)
MGNDARSGDVTSGNVDSIDILAAIDSWPVPHAAAAIVHGTSIVTRGDTSHRFRLASISKVITAWACLIAVEEGSVTLDDPVGPPGSTLRHCLSHAAGYGFDTANTIIGVEKRRVYSNTGIERAAQHVAERSGIPFADYVREAIFEPLAMADSELKSSAAYGIWSTVDDLCRFVAELMHPRLITAETGVLVRTIQFPPLGGVIPGLGSFSPNPWGIGAEIRGDKSPHWTGTTNSPSTFGHFGGSGTMMWIDPTIDTALIALTDRDFDEWAPDALVAWRNLSDAVVASVR